MRFDTSDDVFVTGLVKWLGSLDDATLSDFAKVLRLSPGYYPSTLAAYRGDEMRRRGIPETSHDVQPPASLSLPVCHPADYEWRFTRDSRQDLTGRATAGLGPGAVVAHIGTPSTFAEGIHRTSRFQHILLERNEAVVAALARVTHAPHAVVAMDLVTGEVPSLEAAAAVIDPPWYMGDTLIFLKAAARATALGARILLCQPTEATRPGVAEERERLLGSLPTLGFKLTGTHRSHVRYEMPHFEMISLRTETPHLRVPRDWRTGDLIVLERSGNASPLPVTVPAEEPFREKSFGPVRVKMRRTSQPDMGTLVEGDVLDTVSRRDPVRSRIGLWTSGNRVFHLWEAEAMSELVGCCHDKLMGARFTLESTLQSARTLGVSPAAASRLFGVLLLELQEHLMYAKGKGS
jgi:hypothetical protein